MAEEGNRSGAKPEIGVVGLWHLGCTIAASWAKLGHTVHAVDLDEKIVKGLQEGRAPLFEPGLDEAISSGLKAGRLSFSKSLKSISSCRFVFVTFDTPVREDDSPDLTPIEEVIAEMSALLRPDAIVIVSAQLPVGSSRRLRAKLKEASPSVELAYSPENLRLGEALACYSRPGHVVIGADNAQTAEAIETLFAPMQAQCLKMNLPSAEMTKHGINSFLATSITFANQLANLCEASGADFSQVAAAMKQDPRIGKSAYLSAGIGFSGGTLGRDLQVLDQWNKDANGVSPFFGEIWRLNRGRVGVVRARCEQALGSLRGKTIALLGLTYKPGTSTLRQSLPLEVAKDLLQCGAIVRAYDPKADWSQATPPAGLVRCSTAYEAASKAHVAILLTEWPEFQTLDFARLKSGMSSPVLFDSKGMWKQRLEELNSLGFQVLLIGRS